MANQVVRVGSVVTVEIGGIRETYTILDEHDISDPASGRITSASPLGACLLGAEKGAVISFETPDGTEAVKVVEIA